MDVGRMVEEARERAGSDDLGPDSWQEPLEVLVASLTTEADLNAMGASAMNDQIVGYLVNRLEVEQWYSKHPEIDDEEIVAPLIGLGLPRTGSTALSFLLAQDPHARSLLTWQSGEPCPPPSTVEGPDPRIERAIAAHELQAQIAPRGQALLPTSPTGPMECQLLMALDFRSLIFEGMAKIPAYSSWLLECDMTPAYRYHQRVLKLLQWRCGPTAWSLRTPAHMLSIDALDAVYPDARFVMTHRDVGKVLPSVCALYDTFRSVLSDRPDPLGIGQANVATWALALERLVAFRDAGHDDRFHDLRFDDVQRDPLGSIERLYAALGDELTEVARGRMQDWWTASAAARPPAPHHAPETYGLDPIELRERFAFYHDRFDVPLTEEASDA